MKKTLLSLALSLILSVPAFAATTIGTWEGVNSADPAYQGTQPGAAAGDSANGIIWTRHNLSSYGEHYQATKDSSGTAGYVSGAEETTEVCVFCHTPHHGKTTSAPLWNKATTSTYTAYGTTVAGTTVSTVGGSSLACLGCHDGVTTLDSMINKPGKSGVVAAGAPAGYAFIDKAGQLMVGGNIDSPTINSSRLNIGTTVANDHPISIAYNGGTAASLRATTTVISSIPMENAQAFGGAAIYGRSDNLWSVKGFISNTATIADLLRDGGQVQCASCHDPHYKNQTNNDPAVVASYGVGIPQNGVDHDGLFLRRVGGNSNSGVCRTCHNK